MRKDVAPFDWTSDTAPRQGGKPGRKNRISAQSLKIIEALLDDFRQHGQKTIDFLRIEQPDKYARLVVDVASKLVILHQTGGLIGETPPTLVVHWLSAPRAPQRIVAQVED